MTRWNKLGLIFVPSSAHEWMTSHASNPTVEWLNDTRYRVYFGCRDSQRRGNIASFVFDLNKPTEIQELSSEPLLGPGPVGCFDDSGVSMGCLQSLPNGDRYLYYVGWNLGVTVPWRNSIGLAVSSFGSKNFERYSLAPVLDRCSVDPYSLSYPWVIQRSPQLWLMYYGSNLTWGPSEAHMNHVIKIASSEDGVHWVRDGRIAIDLRDNREIGISRPCVVADGSTFKMWYSYRGEFYRIGYAESSDGYSWKRLDDKVGIDVSSAGWDSKSISYGCIFDNMGKRFMLYNGNEYGRTGIGLAEAT